MASEEQHWYKTFFREDYLATYARLIEAATPQQASFLKKIIGHPEGQKILDLCCGHGRHALELLGSGYWVAGLDLSDVLLEHGIKEAARSGLQQRFVQGDMRRLPFADACFNVVYMLFNSFGYFASVEEDRKVLEESYRVLQKGGMLIMEIGNDENMKSNFVPLRRYDQERIVFENEYLFHPEESVVEITQRIPAEDGIHIHVAKVRSYPKKDLEAQLLAAHLQPKQAWGDYRFEPYTPASKRLIIMAAKE